MRIAMLAGADSVHSWRWVEYFARRGHEMHWISLARFAGPAPQGVRTYDLGDYMSRNYDGTRVVAIRPLMTPRGMVATLQAVVRMRRVLRDVSPQVFHIHSAGTYGFLGAVTGFHPLIVTPWGSDVLLAARSAFKRPFIKYALRRADAITCDANHMREAMVRLGTEAAKIRIIYFGTNTDTFHPGIDGADIRKKYALGDAPVVLSTRRLQPLYDVASLVQAMPRILEVVPNAHCLVLGDGEERERLVALAVRLGVAHRVHFAGSVTEEEVPRYLGAADIYVSTSLSDAGLAASTAEAMACGLPVVVTDSADNDAWVAEGLGGFLVPVRRPDVLAEKIIYLALHPEERQRFGAYNRPVIEQRNNSEVEMGKVERLYGSIARTCKAA